MNIRQATTEDIGSIREIAELLYIEIPDFVWNTEDFIKGQIEKGEYYVAEDVGRVIGIMSLKERNNMLYIETLAVARDIQAKGVGSRLVDFAKDFAGNNNFKTMRTTSFYEYGVKDYWLKRGFRLLDESGEYAGHKFYRFEMEI